MAGTTATLVAIATAAMLALSSPGAAAARYSPEAPGSSVGTGLAVKDSANVSRNGTSVYWRLTFHCPHGRPYTLTAEIRQPAVLPPEFTDRYASYTAARGDKRGVCAGHTQVVGMRLAVVPTVLFAGDGTASEVTLPLVLSDTALVAKAYLHSAGDQERGYPYYCSYIPSETEDGTVCEDATQVGPLLRLR